MDIFHAIAEPRRRDILELLATHGQLSASDISQNFKVSPPAISQHLKVLREAELVLMNKMAQQHIYQLNPVAFSQLEEWTIKLKSMWSKRFIALETLLKTT